MFSESHFHSSYIGGAWVAATGGQRVDVLNPATERSFAAISTASLHDVDRAVAAARAAFIPWSSSTAQERVQVLQAILAEYVRRLPDLARTVSLEMGAPRRLAYGGQVLSGKTHLTNAIGLLESFVFESDLGPTRMVREPIGVAGMITPWNWPLHQIVSKVGPALAMGCTMVLKPSEIAPLNAILFAEIVDAAGVPAGVFNLVQGSGATVGSALAAHPDVDVISFTGSTRAGVLVAEAAAPSVKRVTQELGGKSPNILLEDVDLEAVMTRAVTGCFSNSGQSCNAPTRLLVPESLHDEAAQIAASVAAGLVTGDPAQESTDLGPVVSGVQFDRVQSLIQAGIDSGARLVEGGLGRPAGLDVGWYVRPTVFAEVENSMQIATEEIFGPVLSILPYKDEEHAISVANDTEFGLAAYVSSGDLERARRVGRRLRAGQVVLNGGTHDGNVPFGGYKKSGNGRERGEVGMDDYLEYKALVGYTSP